VTGTTSAMFGSPGAIAFQVGPLSVRWYGILVATAIGLGLWMAEREARAEGLPTDTFLRVVQWGVVAGFLGARLYEVLFNWNYYGQHPGKIVAVWEGGLAIHGGLIAGPVVGMILAWRWRLPILQSLDVVAPGLALGQAIGRWGNFFNEEAFGQPTDLPWGLHISAERRPPGLEEFQYFHPTFLYESLWDLGVFLVLVLCLRTRGRARPGALFFAYIGLYSIGRGLIESLRLDSFWVGGFRVAQLASAAGVLVAAGGLAWVSRVPKRPR
jgi:phosphatidylglycerol:prolipoprotein diacylglycerol transferase